MKPIMTKYFYRRSPSQMHLQGWSHVKKWAGFREHNRYFNQTWYKAQVSTCRKVPNSLNLKAYGKFHYIRIGWG